MKTSKTVEVAYNIVRYQDPLHQYCDWHATPQNPLGNRGSIALYESPLSAFTLAGLFLIVNSSDFMTRVNSSRYFTLCHLIGSYLLLVFFFFRKDIPSLVVLSFFLFFSSFTISYSTRPLAETHALFYQALLMVIAAKLLHSPMSPIKKSAILALGVSLLCAGGKMNYFLLATPLILLFPLLDTTFKTKKDVLKYFSLFILVAGLGAAILLIFTSFSFERAWIYLIKGNKPLINGSLWETFIEGFDGFPDVYDRTREQFGSVVFYIGKYGGIYMLFKLAHLLILKGRRELTRFEIFQSVLAIFILGHALNYIILRNLFIPHRYYVVPMYTVFCLIIVGVFSDVRSFLIRPNTIKTGLSRIGQHLLRRLTGPRPNSRKSNAALLPCSATIIFLLVVLAGIAGGIAWLFTDSEKWQTNFIQAYKILNSSALAMDIIDIYAILVDTLWSIAIIAVSLAILIVLTAPIFRKSAVVQRIASNTCSVLKTLRISAASIALSAALFLLGSYAAIMGGKQFYHYVLSHAELIEYAERLGDIRRDTNPGDLVLCWKWCMAFYADKRSITDATPKDFPYYKKHNLHSVMGPVRPLDLYYKRIEKYPEPMSYWRPKTPKELEASKSLRLKALQQMKSK